MKIVIAPQARDDLKQAYNYIRRDNAQAADQELARISEIIGLLASGAMKGKEVLLKNGKRVNTWSVPPHRLYYRITEQRFEIVRVYHQARQPIER